MDTEDGRRGIGAVEKGMTLLEALSRAGGPLPLKDLARRTGLDPSQAHRYAVSFIRAGLVRQDQASGLYDLGPAALRLGLAALDRLDVVAMAGPLLPDLARETQLTVLLCVLGDRGPTIVRWQRAALPFVTALGLGTVLPLMASATGRVFLAFAPRALRDGLIAAAGGGPPGLEDNLERVQARGYETTAETVIPGISAVAAPLLDAQEEAAAVITLVGAAGDLDRARTEAIKPLIRVAAGLSSRLGAPDRMGMG